MVKMKPLRLWPAVGAALVASSANGQALYSLFDLGDGGGVATVVGGVGPGGSMTGAIEFGAEARRAFYFDGNTMVDLGTLGGSMSGGVRVNAAGIVVGASKLAGDFVMHAFWSDGITMHDLGSFGGWSFANGINDRGTIVGEADDADGRAHAFVFNDGVMTDLAPSELPASSTDIASNGEICGYYTPASGGQAFLYDGTFHALGSPPDGGGSVALSLNDVKEVVGYYAYPYGSYHIGRAFVYQNGVMSVVATASGDYSYAYAVNNTGEIVGRYGTVGGGQSYGCLIQNLQIVNLNGLIDGSGAGYTVTDARDINDNGQIAASALTPDGSEHAVLLTPHYPVQPTAYTLYRGRYVSGGLSDLFDSDDAYLRVYPGLVMNGFEAPVQVVVTGTARSLSRYSDLRLELEAHVSSPNLRQTIELYDYQSGQWVNLDTTMGTSSDSVRTAIAPDPSRFVQFLTNEVKARLSWKPAGLVNAWPWTASLDQVQWTVTP